MRVGVAESAKSEVDELALEPHPDISRSDVRTKQRTKQEFFKQYLPSVKLGIFSSSTRVARQSFAKRLLNKWNGKRLVSKYLLSSSRFGSDRNIEVQFLDVEFSRKWLEAIQLTGTLYTRTCRNRDNYSRTKSSAEHRLWSESLAHPSAWHHAKKFLEPVYLLLETSFCTAIS